MRTSIIPKDYEVIQASPVVVLRHMEKLTYHYWHRDVLSDNGAPSVEEAVAMLHKDLGDSQR